MNNRIIDDGDRIIHAIDIAIDEIGIREKTGSNDGIPARKYMRGDNLAWCAGFVLYCNDVSDDPDVARNTKEYYEMRNVNNFESVMKDRGVFIGRNVTPQRNDFIFFGTRMGSDVSKSGRHMGIVEDVLDGYIHTIEGNTSNMVARRKYKIGHAKITGFARVIDLVNEPDIEWDGVPFA